MHHEIDIFSNRISVCNPGCFANKYQPIDYATRDIHSYLRNEVIAKALYLSNNVETFGSGIKNIYKLCNETGITVSYTNEEEAFTMEFSRRDRNSTTLQNRDYEKQKQIDIVSTRHSDGEINGEVKHPDGEINGDQIIKSLSADELLLLNLLTNNPAMTNPELATSSGKSPRTVSRILSALKRKKLLTRVGSNKTGFWVLP